MSLTQKSASLSSQQGTGPTLDTSGPAQISSQNQVGNAALQDQLPSDTAGIQQFCNVYGSWTVYGDDFIGPLPMSTAQDYHVHQAEYLQVMSELDLFHIQCYGEQNFHPSTGPGVFDVSFTPIAGQPGTLFISLRVAFDFVAARAPADYPGAAPEDLDWQNEEEKTTFASECLSAINSTWSGAMQFQVNKPFWENVLASVQVNVMQSDDAPHYTITVQKIPPGEWAGSDASAPGSGSNHGTANFDSEDVNLATKPGGEQRAAVHEFGHMIGLGDEYAGKSTPRHAASFKSATGEDIATGDDDRIMSGGENILAEHYITFLEGLRSVTGVPEWNYES